MLTLQTGPPRRSSLELSAATRRTIARLAHRGRVDIDVAARATTGSDTARVRVVLRPSVGR